MQILRSVAPAALFLAGACQTYSPAPVDLGAHAAAFAARLPDSDAVRGFVAALAGTSPAPGQVDLADGISLAEGRLLALLFHPDCRLARQRAGITAANAAEAGRWDDPELGLDFERILESVEHPWLVGASIGLSLPLSGRKGLERDLAHGEHAEAIAAARLAELDVLDRLDAAWLSWSASMQRVDLLRDLCARLDELVGIADRLAAAHELTMMQARAFRLERAARGHELAVAESDATQRQLELTGLLGLHPQAPLRLQPTFAAPPRSTSAGDRERSLGGSPRLLQLRRAHETAEKALELAIAGQWPDLVLSPGFGEEDAQPRATLGFSLPLPLWNGNAQRIAAARAARDLAAESLRCGHEQLAHELARREQRALATKAQRDAIAAGLLPLAAQQLDDGRALAGLGELDTLLILDALVRSHEARLLAVDTTLAAALAEASVQSLCNPDLLPTTVPADPTPETAR